MENSNINSFHPNACHSITSPPFKGTIYFLIVAIFIIVYISIFYHLGELPLLQPDEGRNAEVAREMHENGSWLIPTYDEMVYLDKPAFYFKTVAISFALLGESPGVARLSSAISAILLLTVLFLFCLYHYSLLESLLAVIVLASTPLFIAFSRLVIFDMTLAFFVCSAIFAGYIAEAHEGYTRRIWHLAGAASAGFAVLVKGPIGFILPVVVLNTFYWFDGNYSAIKRYFFPLNIILMLGIVLPWFISVSWWCPDFPYYGLVRESFSRFTTAEFHRTGPFYYYLPVILGGFFAWSLLLPEAAMTVWRKRTNLSSTDCFFIIWGIVIVGFFSFSQSKLPGYILTAIIALGVLVARLFATALRRPNGHAARIVRHGSLLLFMFMIVLAVLIITFPLTANLIEHLFKIPKSVILTLKPHLLLATLSLTVIGLLAAWAYGQRSIMMAFIAFLAFPLLLIGVNGSLLSSYAKQNSVVSIMQRMPALSLETDIVCWKCFPTGLPFYLQRPITVVTDTARELTSNYITFQLHKGASLKHIVRLSDWDEWLNKHENPIYLMANKNGWKRLEKEAIDYKVPVIYLNDDYRAIFIPSPMRSAE